MRIVAISAFVCSLGLLGACGAMKPYDPVVEDPLVVDREFPFDVKALRLSSGGVELFGTLREAQGRGPHPTVVVARGFPDPESNVDVAMALRRAGFNILSFYYRGFWGMGGYYTMMNSLEDLKAVIESLRTERAEKEWRVDRKRIILLGYSFGGPIALKAASQDPEIRALILMDASDLRFYKNLSPKDYEDGVSEIDTTFGVRASGKQVIDEIVAQQDFWDPIRSVRGLSGKCVLSVLATNGEAKHQFPPYFTDAMRANERFTAVTLDTDHGFIDHRIALTRTVVSWAQGLWTQSCL